MRKLELLTVVTIVLVAAAAVVAQEPPEMPKPGPEHAALGSWVGSWAGDGELKPGMFGEGGPMSWSEECSWFGNGRYHIVCKSEGTGPMGQMKGLGIIGYDPNKQVYVHYGIDDGGWMNHSEGKRDGDKWTFKSKEKMGDTTYYSRMNMTMESAEKIVFSWEMSEDGETWTTLMDGASVKQ